MSAATQLTLKVGIEELRHLVKNFAYQSEDFNCRFTVDQLIKLHRAHIVCGWDFFPDQWSGQQIEEALLGIAPDWDPKTEKPIYPESRWTARFIEAVVSR